MMPRISIRKCVEPDDLNFLGWDLLVSLEGGHRACFAEVTTFERAMQIVNRQAPPEVLTNAELHLRLWAPIP